MSVDGLARSSRTTWNGLRTSTRGNVVVLFGLSLVPVMAAVGAATDYSRLTRTKTALQSAADAAALAGARALSDSEGQPEQVRAAAASKSATDVIQGQAPEATRTVTPVLAANQVKVDLGTELKLVFGPFLGNGWGAVGSTATATYAKEAAACFVALGPNEPVGIDLTGSAKISASKCGIYSNSTTASSIRVQGAPKIVGSRVCAVGDAPGGRSHITPPASTGCEPAPDPYPGRLPLQTGSCDHNNMSFPNAQKTAVLSPGVYCGGISIGGTEVTLLPGLYELRDGPLSIQGSGSITGLGVSLLLRGANASLQLQGSPKVTLTAMTTGPLAGIAIAAVPSTPILTSTLQGSPDLSLTGSLYLPNQRLRMQGSPTVNMLGAKDRLAALSFDLQGSPDITLASSDTALPGSKVTNLRLSH